MNETQASEAIKDFLNDNHEAYAKALKAKRSESNHCIIDFGWLKDNPQLMEYFIDNPEEALSLSKIYLKELTEKETDLRLENVDNFLSTKIKISELRITSLGKLVCLKGMIRQISSVTPVITKTRHECPNCGFALTVLQNPDIGDALRIPTSCKCGRKSGFRLLGKEYEDTQTMLLEEDLDEMEGGKQPEKVVINLRRGMTSTELTQINTPGTRVIVTGYLREAPKSFRGGESINRKYLIEANYIKSVEEKELNQNIDEKTEKKIIELSQDPKLFEKLIESFAPDIYGYEYVKEGLILSLFGCVPKFIQDQQSKKLRKKGTFNVLLMGDPGIAKTQLAQYVSFISPKSRYVSGSRASGAGLTAIPIKDEATGAWAIEAGAVVLANNGTCIIDEFDKVREEDMGRLHQAMESQRINVDKANIHASLKAETSIIGIANPKYGRFDPGDGMHLAKQFNIPEAVLSRFDLIYILRDKVDREMDENVIDSIINAHIQSDKVKAKIDPSFIKKYIIYARRNVNPKLTKPIQEEIKKTYQKFRVQSEKGTVSFTPRQGEAIIRLSEAAARARLSDKVEIQDFQRAHNLIMKSLEYAFDKESGKLDIDILELGETTKDRKERFSTDNILEKLFEHRSKIPYEELSQELIKSGKKEEEAEKIIENLKIKGEIYFPKQGEVAIIR